MADGLSKMSQELTKDANKDNELAAMIDSALRQQRTFIEEQFL